MRDSPCFSILQAIPCGLSKAYHLLERMSEDIDLGLRIENQDGLNRSALRRALRELKGSLVETFKAAQFGLRDEAIGARNENRFISFDLAFASRYAQDRTREDLADRGKRLIHYGVNIASQSARACDGFQVGALLERTLLQLFG